MRVRVGTKEAPGSALDLEVEWATFDDTDVVYTDERIVSGLLNITLGPPPERVRTIETGDEATTAEGSGG